MVGMAYDSMGIQRDIEMDSDGTIYVILENGRMRFNNVYDAGVYIKTYPK